MAKCKILALHMLNELDAQITNKTVVRNKVQTGRRSLWKFFAGTSTNFCQIYSNSTVHFVLKL